MQRVFLALWPPASVVERLRTVVPLHVSGRHMRADTLHMTLAFIGNADEAGLERIATAAASIQAPPFTLRLDHLGYWASNHILWAGPSRTPRELLELAGGLRDALDAQAVPYDPHRFTPHVTLVRNASAVVPARLPEPIEWDVAGWCLVSSRPDALGPHYELLARWRCHA